MGGGEGAEAAKGMGHYRRVGWGLGKGFVSQGGWGIQRHRRWAAGGGVLGEERQQWDIFRD